MNPPIVFKQKQIFDFHFPYIEGGIPVMKIIVDNSYSKIVDITEEDEKILEIIDSTLSCYQPGYQFSDAYQMGVWDGKIRFLNKRNYTFPSGLLNVVKEVIPESVEIVYNITPFDIEVPEEINLLEPNAEKGYITLRDYQSIW